MQITVVALMCHTLANIDWKAHSIYSGEQWAIGRIKCVPGNYVIKGAI
jgi:hypothetical protein